MDLIVVVCNLDKCGEGVYCCINCSKWCCMRNWGYGVTACNCWLHMTAAVSTKAQKYGGDLFHPIGNVRGKAISACSISGCCGSPSCWGPHWCCVVTMVLFDWKLTSLASCLSCLKDYFSVCLRFYDVSAEESCDNLWLASVRSTGALTKLVRKIIVALVYLVWIKNFMQHLRNERRQQLSNKVQKYRDVIAKINRSSAPKWALTASAAMSHRWQYLGEECNEISQLCITSRVNASVGYWR